jgi:CubicO group peptidase (beta-lactamase class C family)
MRRRDFSSFVGLSAAVPLSALAALTDAPEGCTPPSGRADGWPVAAMGDDKAVDTAALCRMADRLVASNANIHSVLVAHAGRLVFERYFRGMDEVPGRLFGRRVEAVDFTPDTLHFMKSVSKSVASLALGIAIDRGLVASIETPIFDFFPELSNLRTPDKDAILLKHVLTMTTGLAWVESTPTTGDFFNDEARMHMASDPCRYVLGRPMEAPAGQAFHYSTGALALVAAVVRKAVGRHLDEFAQETLFAPLGISGVDWNRVGGETDAGGGLRLHPRDMAKLGQLVLSRGRWNGRQVVSSEWIEASTTTSTAATDDQTYGYLWWGGSAAAGGQRVRWIGALGRGGQSIRIVPECDLVVVVTAGYYQDYSREASRTQYGVFRDALKAVLPHA